MPNTNLTVMLAAWRRIYDGKADRASLPEAWQGVIQSWTVLLPRTRSEREPAYLEIHNTYTSVPEDPGADLRLIRFRGHLPKGGYDVPNGQHDETPAAAPAV